MAEYKITCVVRSDAGSGNEHITHIGNQEDKWLLSKEAVIQHIQSNAHQFYTGDAKGSTKSHVSIVKELKKPAYLRAHSHNKWNDSLMALPDCGEDCKFLG
ncbi:MAG: DUF3892 domain-containing protein [Limisphaerales bacterium]